MYEPLGRQKLTGNSNNQQTITGEIVSFYMPQEGFNNQPFPIAVCKFKGFDTPLPLRWGEPTELINIIGKPKIGTKVEAQVDQDQSPLASKAFRQFTSGYGDVNSNKDDRGGISYLAASTFSNGQVAPSSVSDTHKQLGVPGSSVAVIATEKEVVMKGGTNYRIISSSEFGNIITGPLSISTSFSKIRVGGLWQLNPLLQSTIPSTIVTPIPVFIFSPPASGLKGIAKIIKYCKDLLL